MEDFVKLYKGINNFTSNKKLLVTYENCLEKLAILYSHEKTDGEPPMINKIYCRKKIAHCDSSNIVYPRILSTRVK